MKDRCFPWRYPSAVKAFAADSDTEDALQKTAVSGRIRLMRNVRGFPFPPNASQEQKAAIRERVRGVLEKLGKWTEYRIDELSDEEKLDLIESKTVTPGFTQDPQERSLFASVRSPWLTVQVNGDDHLVLQAYAPGSCLEKLYRRVEKLEDALAKELDFAFHPQFGFETNDPANAGTGLEASVLLHLPAMGIARDEKTMLAALKSMGLAALGFFGDEQKFPGNLYTVINRTKMGESESVLLNRMSECVRHIAREEMLIRERLRKKHPLRVLDFCARSKAVLEHSHLISTVETMNALSGLRLADESEIHPLPFCWDAVLFYVQPGQISRRCGTDNGPEHRAAERAALMRLKMAGN